MTIAITKSHGKDVNTDTLTKTDDPAKRNRAARIKVTETREKVGTFTNLAET